VQQRLKRPKVRFWLRLRLRQPALERGNPQLDLEDRVCVAGRTQVLQPAEAQRGETPPIDLDSADLVDETVDDAPVLV
jgi:hypothetical protein